MLRDLPTDVIPLTDEQRDVIAMVREFADKEIRPIAREVDEADTEVPWDIWHRASKVGITSFMLPEEYGGGGFTDAFTQCLVQEELCAGDSGLGNFLGSSGFFAHPLMELGTEDQRERWLRPLSSERPPLSALCTWRSPLNQRGCVDSTVPDGGLPAQSVIAQ